MAYDLMLLADPGPERTHVLETLRSAPDIRPDSQLDNRFYLKTPHGEACLNVGTKNPVESVHVELEQRAPALLEAVTRRALELASRLDMYVEDVQWGHEVTPDSLPRLQEYWRTLSPPVTADSAPAVRPWWRFW